MDILPEYIIIHPKSANLHNPAINVISNYNGHNIRVIKNYYIFSGFLHKNIKFLP